VPVFRIRRGDDPRRGAFLIGALTLEANSPLALEAARIRPRPVLNLETGSLKRPRERGEKTERQDREKEHVRICVRDM